MSKRKDDVVPKSVGDTDEYEYYSDEEADGSESDELIDTNELKGYEPTEKPNQIKTPQRKAIRGVINKDAYNNDAKLRNRERKSPYSEVNINKHADLLNDRQDEPEQVPIKGLESKQSQNRPKNPRLPQKMNYYSFNNTLPQYPPQQYNPFNPYANMYGYPPQMQLQCSKKSKKKLEPLWIVLIVIAIVICILFCVGIYLWHRNGKYVKFQAESDKHKSEADAKQEELNKIKDENKNMSNNMFKDVIPTNDSDKYELSGGKKSTDKFNIKPTAKKNSKLSSRPRDAQGRFIKMNK